jgi:hypothetical protein
MVAKAYDFPQQIRGDTWNITVNFKDEAGSAIDITGNQYWFTLKSNIDSVDNDAAIQLGPFTADIADASLGILSFSVSGVLTKELQGISYHYDLQEVTSSNEVSTILIGKIRIRKDVTLTAEYTGVPVVDVSSSSGTALYSGETTSTSPTEIYVGNVSGNTLDIDENSVLSFSALIVGKDSINDQSCAFQFNGAIERDSGDTTAIIGTVGKTILGYENASFDASVSADTNYLKITVTAASTNNTKWSARVTYTEVSY